MSHDASAPVGANHSPSERNQLFELVYADLRRQARALMRGEPRGHTLTPTALVHEAYLRLVRESRLDGIERLAFLRIGARAMRQILIDHARARNAQKRGRGWKHVTITTHLGHDPVEYDALALHDALETLAERDARAAAVTEMRVFGGMTHTEISEALGVSRRTVDTDWAFARKWLSREMA